MATGYDGLIYSIGLVGWPVITFLMAERLRNLEQDSPSADVAGYRFKPGPIRAFAASGTLVVIGTST